MSEALQHAAATREPGAFAAKAPLWVVAAVLVVVAFATTVALPLATYTTILALFGLAHVGSELRYLDFRYGSRLRGGLGLGLALLLCGAVAARLASLTHILAPSGAIVLELACGAGMAVACITPMRRNKPIAGLIAFGLLSGAVVAPFEMLLVLAIAHNFTPVAFLADALHGAARRRVLALMTIPFLAVPLLIASGLPFQAMAAMGLVAPDLSMIASGGLERNLGVYVPASIIESDWALHIFSAAVFTQCMHYALVILVLPLLIDPARRTVVRWPRPDWFAASLVVATGILCIGFLIDFKAARSLYGVMAMVHSWIEVPILVLALDRSGPIERVEKEPEAGRGAVRDERCQQRPAHGERHEETVSQAFSEDDAGLRDQESDAIVHHVHEAQHPMP